MYYLMTTHHSFTFTRTDMMLFGVLALWSLIWKGMALWRAGRNNQPAWFVVMLVLNTAGILEICYLLFFQPKSSNR
jgi:methionyl-tRNA synthetase